MEATDQPYNGSTALVMKMEELLGQKKLSTSAAMRLLLEKELSDIKRNHERDERIKESEKQIIDLKNEIDVLKKTSIGRWILTNPKKAGGVILFLYSFSISGLPSLFFQWLFSSLKLLF